MTMPWSLVPTGQSVLGRVRLSSEIRRLVRFRDQKDDLRKMTSVSLLKKYFWSQFTRHRPREDILSRLF